jgi:serine/threonine-protein kinase HipA
MTSEKECYVYIVLPGKTEFVTAGKFILDETQSGDKVGRFFYGRSYLKRSDAVALDPVELTLSGKTCETGLMGGVFGALRDAAPDLWGRILIERYLGRVDVSEMEYLLNSPDDRIGALGFGLDLDPPSPLQKFNSSIDLERLQRFADVLTVQNPPFDSLANRAEELLLIGTSMGGARPKAVISDEGALWVAKFSHPSDRWDAALAEHAMLRLASDCGIDAAESRVVRVGERNILLVKRFDREKSDGGYKRHRMISALTALRTDDNPIQRAKWSYLSLVEELRRFSSDPSRDARELFVRMVFNALITNTDDHPRNHAFIARDSWELAPAYDLTPFPMIGTERRDLAMICGGEGRFARAKNLLSECRRFLLEIDEAEDIIHSVYDRVKKDWYKTARSVGMTKNECELIRPAFVYPGFTSN